jgi:hypothetical protein
MQHGDMDREHRQEALAYRMGMQSGNAARTSSMEIQLLIIYFLFHYFVHVHVNVHTTCSCRMACSRDMLYGHATWSCSVYMQRDKQHVNAALDLDI